MDEALRPDQAPGKPLGPGRHGRASDVCALPLVRPLPWFPSYHDRSGTPEGAEQQMHIVTGGARKQFQGAHSRIRAVSGAISATFPVPPPPAAGPPPAAAACRRATVGFQLSLPVTPHFLRQAQLD